jgi:hypothetical protein
MSSIEGKGADWVAGAGEVAPPAILRRQQAFADMLRNSAVLLALLAVGAVLAPLPTLSIYFFQRQDAPVIAGTIVLYGALSFWRGGFAERPNAALLHDRMLALRVAVLGLALMIIGVVGHHVVMWGYAFSRDEQMTLFDADVYRTGHFVARLPAEWRHYAPALNTLFMPEAVKGVGAISIYRPGNAMWHALAGLVADPTWANPLLSALSLVATWRVARRVMPGDTGSQWIAVLLFATSTQVMAMSMTTYAMTGRLALGMIWLALFLRDRWPSHLAAMAVAFVATGWQQPIYFPFFAGPFLYFSLVHKRRWGWSAAYAAVFGASLVFWSRFSGFAIRELGVVAKPSDVDGFLLTRMWWALSDISPAYLWNQCANLVRFFAWENLLLLPLLVAGVRVAVRSKDPRLWGMIGSIVALIVMKTILRPYQGHGWGYRYMHGVIGIACILAAMGWRDLRDRGLIGKKHLAVATGAGLILFTPFLMWQSHRFAGEFARVDRAILASPAKIAIVDDGVPEFTGDLVYNPPVLGQRPVRLLASKLDPADMRDLCRRGPIGFVGAAQLAGITRELGYPDAGAQQQLLPLRRASQAAHCRVVPIAVAEP